ncbi:MAG: AGE family epimerase/isomerase, partial [Microlunatus sp.]|nr:AGE family epimerase/isomerase [Microlunatus sp.]
MTNNVAAGANWSALPTHIAWLDAERDRLLRFHERHGREAAVGFATLDANGAPIVRAPRELYSTARLVHCFAIEHLLGRPGAADLARHGLDAITGPFRDPSYGGWYAAIGPDGSVADDTKSSYAHAFVILAGASATQAGLPGGRELLDEALSVVTDRLWDETESAVIEACLGDWTVAEPDYRGQNANMHLTEAYLAAYEATGDQILQRRAERIATKIIHQHARAWDWRVPEHFNG